MEHKMVIGFRRSSGWAMAGRDELRSKRADDSGSWRDRKCNLRQLKMCVGSDTGRDEIVQYRWEGMTGN
jgi:hypothetical protein